MRRTPQLLVLACFAMTACGRESSGTLTPDAAASAPDAAVEPDRPGRDEALAELRASIMSIDAGWRFQLDAADAGRAGGWQAEHFDDAAWPLIDAGATWEDRGYPGYDGVAWYRRTVDVPAAWAGSSVRLNASGVDDEYDVYVNGELIRHYGQYPDRSVYGWRTGTELGPSLRHGEQNTIAIRVVDWGGGGGIWRAIELRREVALEPYAHLLPQPVLDGNPEWLELYWVAWKMAWNKVSFGNAANVFADAYMDEGFNEQIYQWDSSFMCMFGRYGMRLFPVMETLESFYDNQRLDGYIQRVYSETTGGELGEPTAEEPMVNPPLFAWVEWQYYQFSADASRLTRVLPILERYYEWLQSNVRRAEGNGLYYQTELGSGMDNTPRGPASPAAWIDMSAQQVLAARSLARIARATGDDPRALRWEREAASLSAAINDQLWSEVDGWYYDRLPWGDYTGVRHIGTVWTLLAEVASTEQAARIAAHLRNPSEFYRAHLFPGLSAEDPSYHASGNYWRGGVWAPTNYMAIKGLERAGQRELAQDATVNHLTHMARAYAEPPTDLATVAPEEQDGDYRTIWECYAPDGDGPATRWDDTYLSRQDFVGWSGLGPIALLIENVIGLEVRGADDEIIWTVSRTDRHGVQRLPLGIAGTVDLIAAARQHAGDALHVTVVTDRPFTLEVRREGQPPRRYDILAGTTELAE